MTTDLRAQYLLAMVLLVINGTALVLLAHKTGAFSATLFSAIALLFMVVPMVPWGLREALAVTSMIYLIFTLSTLSAPVQNFTAETLWALQFLMLGSGTISLALVARSVSTRKHEIEARYELERSHQQMERLSMQDPLTGTWNRRYLAANFGESVARIHGTRDDCHFAVFDIDRFKQINDSHGHAFGDRFLQSVAKAYAGVLKPDELLVRLGGDEFAMLMRDNAVRTRLWQASGALQAYVRELGVTPAVRPTVSMGLLKIPTGCVPLLDRAYALADTALYDAKRAGGNRIVDAAIDHAADRAETIADGRS